MPGLMMVAYTTIRDGMYDLIQPQNRFKESSIIGIMNVMGNIHLQWAALQYF